MAHLTAYAVSHFFFFFFFWNLLYNIFSLRTRSTHWPVTVAKWWRPNFWANHRKWWPDRMIGPSKYGTCAVVPVSRRNLPAPVAMIWWRRTAPGRPSFRAISIRKFASGIRVPIARPTISCCRAKSHRWTCRRIAITWPAVCETTR